MCIIHIRHKMRITLHVRYLVIFQCFVHIKVAAVSGQRWNIQAIKSKITELVHKPSELVCQHREDGIVAQLL